MKKIFLIFLLAILIGCREKKEIIIPQENLFFIIQDIPFLENVNLPYDVNIAYLKKKNVLSYTIYDSSQASFKDSRVFSFYNHKDSAVLYHDFKNDRLRLFYYNGDNLLDSIRLYYHTSNALIDTPDYTYIYKYTGDQLDTIISDYISVYNYKKDLTVIHSSQNRNRDDGRISVYESMDSLFYEKGRIIHIKHCSNKIKNLADVHFKYEANRLIETTGKSEYFVETNFGLSYNNEGYLTQIRGSSAMEFIYDSCGIAKEIKLNPEKLGNVYTTRIIYQ